MRFFTGMTWYGITLGHHMSWGVYLAKCQHDQKSDQMSTWSKSLSLGGGVHVMSIISIHIWKFGGSYLSSYWYFLHIFCLGMHVIDCEWSDIAWQMSPTPREGISLKCSKTYLWSTFHSLSPKLFQHSQCFRDCDPSEIYTYWSFLYKCETF